MKFKILGINLNRIMKIVGSATAKDDSRPILRAINCRIEDNQLIATGLDGYKFIQIIVPCEVLEGDTSEDFNIKPIKGIQSGFIDYTVEVTEENISYTTNGWKLEVPLINGNFIKVKDIYPKTPVVFSISVSPKLLGDVLKSFKNEFSVRFDFYEENHPFTVTVDNGDHALVLPVRRHK